MINVARWEWFKLRKRWMPWILLLVMVLFSQLGVWANYFNYGSVESSRGSVSISRQEGEVPCNDLLSGDTSRLPPDTSPQEIQRLQTQCQQQQPTNALERIRSEFTLPGSIQSALTPAQLVGLILLAILTASVIGAEYGLGTLRPIIAKGTSRTNALAGKFVMLLAVAAGALAVVLLFTAISSVIAGSLAGSSSGGSGDKTWVDAAKALGKAWTSFIPYIALTGAVSVLTRSTAGGMALGLVYYFGEQILVSLLGQMLDWLADVGKYLPVHGIMQWAGSSQAEDPLGAVMLAVMMALYTIGFLVFAFWLFRRRDITGASGG